MDIDKFAKLVLDRRRTKDDLKNMLQNAQEKNWRGHAILAREELDRRFPNWNMARARMGGARETRARFCDRERTFSSAKDAYIWLVNRFIESRPSIFDDPSHETIYVAKGTKRNYFGRNLKKMFHESPDLAEDHNNYALLESGWYANLNLNNAQKFDILNRLAGLSGLKFGKDWEWDVNNPTEKLVSAQSAIAEVDQLLAEIRGE